MKYDLMGVAVGVILVIIGCVIVAWLINRRHERDGADLFRQPGRHRAEPQPEREPDTLDRLIAEHDAPAFLAAPVTAPLDPSAVLTPAQARARTIDPREDSVWDKHAVEDVWALLNAEKAGAR